MTQITLYSVSKRKNSLAVPSGWTTVNCALKEDTSVIRPVFVLNGDYITPQINYCSWNGRYYWISDRISRRNNLTELVCNVDILATYRSAILSTSGFVVYDNHNNTELIDNRISCKTSASIAVNAGDIDAFDPSVGTYAIVVTGEGSTGVFRVTASILQNIVPSFNDVFVDATQSFQPYGTDIAQNISIGFQNFCQMLFNVLFSGDVTKNIKDAYWTPFVMAGDSPVGLKLGRYNTGESGNPLTGTYSFTGSVNIPWQTSDWRRNSPYTQIYLYAPFLGVVQLSNSDLIGVSELAVNYRVAASDGSYTVSVYTVQTGGGHLILQSSGNAAGHIAIGAGNYINAGSAITGAVKAGIAGAAGGAGSAIMAASASTLDSIMSGGNSAGSSSGCTGWGAEDQIQCVTVLHDTSEGINAHKATIGTPRLKQMAISQCSGYCQTSGFSVNGCNGTDEEKDMINAAMDGGVFIE